MSDSLSKLKKQYCKTNALHMVMMKEGMKVQFSSSQSVVRVPLVFGLLLVMVRSISHFRLYYSNLEITFKFGVFLVK